MYSTHNEGKSVFTERFIRTLKNKIYKHITAVSKNVCFDVLDDNVNKYNNTRYNSIKVKLLNVNLIFMLNTLLILMLKMLNLKWAIM